MSWIPASLLVTGGTGVAYLGPLRSLTNIGTVTGVLVWGLVTIAGLFLLLLGAERLLVDLGTDPKPNPEGALTKTGPRCRRH